MELPPCRWRGHKTGEGKVFCTSPKIVSVPEGIPEDWCRSCRICDHQPPTQKRRVPVALLPCVHLGKVLRQIQCYRCGKSPTVDVLACAKHGETVVDRMPPDVHSCLDCPDKEPDRDKLIAPMGAGNVPGKWEGVMPFRPWHYRMSAVIPHLETPDLLEVVVEQLRLQTVPPYMLVIDTGSDKGTCQKIDRLRDSDLEVHYIRGHGYRHSSEVVAVAMDLAFSLCRTNFLYTTHTDVFYRRRDWLEHLLGMCGPDQPAVGFQMSERNWATTDWEYCLGHATTMFYMPAVLATGSTWSFQRMNNETGLLNKPSCGWPDTETGFGRCLRAAGIRPHFLGQETNGKKHETEYFVHCRTYPGAKIFGMNDYYEKSKRWVEEEIKMAKARIKEWRQGQSDPPLEPIQTPPNVKPTLSIITAVSRPENLPAMADSISRVDRFTVQWLLMVDKDRVADLDASRLPRFAHVEMVSPGNDPGGAPQKNRGIELATGEWVMFLDDDNILHPQFDRVFGLQLQNTYADLWIFPQTDTNGYRLRGPDKLEPGKIDQGQYVVARVGIGDVRFKPDEYGSDYYFLKDLLEVRQLKPKQVWEDCTYYNALRPTEIVVP